MASPVIVLTTAPSSSSANRIAHHLLDRRLAACVQISAPVKSVYLWKKKKETAREYQLWIKTTAVKYPKVEKAIQEIHSYEVPEILAIPVSKGSRDYLKWLARELTG